MSIGAELLDSRVDDFAAMSRRSDIAGDEHRFSPRLFDQSLRLLGVLMLIQVGDDDVRAFTGIGDRNRAADAAVAAGDDGFLARQFVAAAVRVFTVIGPRFHRVCSAGHRLMLSRKRRTRALMLVHDGHTRWRKSPAGEAKPLTAGRKGSSCGRA